jgi:CheY-like chemotaxis protein
LEVRTKPLILVVDDQVTIIRIMSSILKPIYDVCVATSGKKALEVARTQRPDLILLDNLMPEMTGIETCMALKEIPSTKHIPVIFVTSMDDKHNEQMGFKAGAVDYMNKPPSHEVVHARVSVHLRNNQQRQFLERLSGGDITDLNEIQTTAERLLER